MIFTTRPEIMGTFGVATSTHWIASAVGMRILEIGGNAFDAAASMGFVLQVVEPHLNGPLGDMPVLIRPSGADAPTVICGQGIAPTRATIQRYRSEGLTMIPGSGLLAAVVPGAFGAWMLMLQDHGRLRLREVMEPAIHYARHGHPILQRAAETIAGLEEFFEAEWPTSHATWMPGGRAPEPGEIFVNTALADAYDRILAEAESVPKREAQIMAARRAFYEGFVAEAVDDYLRDACVMDASGERRKGVLTGQDMVNWQAAYESPLSVDYRGWTVWKAGAWTQGPSLLQSLRMLSGLDLDAMDLAGSEFVHVVTEAMKLSFADREAYYGDPIHADIPVEMLVSEEYAADRRGLIGPSASLEQRPGRIDGYGDWADAAVARANREMATGGVGAGEPTMAHLSEPSGDTVHIDVIDRWGNMISATPSGGWLQSSPAVPGLGMPLNTRAQMFWLDEGLPNSLAPGRRPRTTLSPSMAEGGNGAVKMAFGTPGGDQQDQWQLTLFLRLVHGGMNLQEGIDAPLFHTGHVQSSFYPRGVRPGHLMVESSFGKDVVDDLQSCGHDVEVAENWTIGRLTAASMDADGVLRAAATPRLMQAYAVGR